MVDVPLLTLEGVEKVYRGSIFSSAPTFQLNVTRTFERSEIVGVMGPNGAGKTTLFEMIAGSNVPSGGRVMVAGQNIQNVRYMQRDRLAIHYHQSYQVRHFSKKKPSFMMERAAGTYPTVHLFDEPQFNTQDGYIGFMLDFFRKLRSENRLVFICLHPTAAYQITIMKEVCERFLFVNNGGVTNHATFSDMARQTDVTQYLGALAH